MKLTNELNLPQPIVDAVRNDSYSRGDADVSVTGLLKPPRMAALEREHDAEIVEDAADRIWSMLGQSVHVIAERANTSGISERRLVTEVEGWKVSGAMDLYYPASGVLYDLKVTSMYKFKDGDVPLEHTQQLNLYAELLRRNGDKIREAYIIGILRDWSVNKTREAGYPKHQVVVKRVLLWEPAVAAAFLRERVVLHQQARVKLPECSPEDRWHRGEAWAVMKPGRKSAVRVYNNEAAAKAHAESDMGLSIQHRAGDSIRCRLYCRAAPFCTQAKALATEPSSELATEESA